MSALTQALFDQLVNDSALTALLGTFGGNPSIFTKTPLPPGVSLETNGPYILTTGEASQDPGSFDTKNSVGREIVRDIRCFADIALSTKSVEDVAERVRDLFHRQASFMLGQAGVMLMTSSPGASTPSMVKQMACTPPQVTRKCSGVTSSPSLSR